MKLTVKQPGSKSCFVCGRENLAGLKLEFYMIEPGKVCSYFNLTEHFESYPGTIHGGIIAAILDECGGRAQMTEPNRFMVTAQLCVRYRRPVPSRTDLVVYGVAGERRGRVSFARSEIQSIDGKILADAELVLMDIPESQYADVDLEAMGWRVYLDEEVG
jgi:acyl-coenzyme A thioesterase PaaI-like protein